MARSPSDTPPQSVLQFAKASQPRKLPRQARSIALVDAVKSSARQILEREGRDALTAQHLSEYSGVAVSSIYEYFPTMEALMAAIFDDYRTEVHRDLIAQLQALPPQSQLFDALLLMLRCFLGVRHKWAHIDADFTARYIRYDELQRLHAARDESMPPAAATLALMARFADQVAVRDHEKVVFLIYHFLQALPRVIALERPEYLGDEDTLILLARMLEALLKGG